MKRYFETLMIISWFLASVGTVALGLSLMMDGTIPQQPYNATIGLVAVVCAFLSFVDWVTYMSRGA